MCCSAKKRKRCSMYSKRRPPCILICHNRWVHTSMETIRNKWQSSRNVRSTGGWAYLTNTSARPSPNPFMEIRILMGYWNKKACQPTSNFTTAVIACMFAFLLASAELLRIFCLVHCGVGGECNKVSGSERVVTETNRTETTMGLNGFVWMVF